jgi:hypothetical protein
MTNALTPNMEHADIVNKPVTFPVTVIRDRKVPNCRLCVDTNNIAGPGIAAAIKAIEQNANQVSKCIIIPCRDQNAPLRGKKAYCYLSCLSGLYISLNE